jgi:hypothetical protein
MGGKRPANKSQIVLSTPPVNVESADSPDAWPKQRRQSRARLLKKIYEVDLLICPKCQGVMFGIILENEVYAERDSTPKSEFTQLLKLVVDSRRRPVL